MDHDGHDNKSVLPVPPWWTIAALLAFAVVLLAGYGWSVGSAAIVVVELMIGVAAIAVGALLGFLFGIPRSQSQGDLRDGAGSIGQANGSAAQPPGMNYLRSTNLEQVSDWLTKIVVGVGLIEFNRLREALASAGDFVASSFIPPVQGASLVSQATIVAFSVIGFLAGFLWTHVYYGLVLRKSDDTLQTIAEQSKQTAGLLEQVARTTLTAPSAAKDIGSLRKADADGIVPSVVEKIEEFQNAPPVYDSDPTGKFFPDAPGSANGRRLVGSIESAFSDALMLSVRVEETAGPSKPLVGDAIFLLHPTLSQPVRRVRCKDGAAQVKFYCNGWFHVVAIVDGGETVLKLDLRQISGIPEWFKEEDE